jgi:hypothetical protein
MRLVAFDDRGAVPSNDALDALRDLVGSDRFDDYDRWRS